MEHLLADERLLSELDHVRLTHLVRRTPAAAGGPSTSCSTAPYTVMPREVPPDVVTMNSRVQVADAKTGAPSVLTLSYPDEADAAAGPCRCCRRWVRRCWGGASGRRCRGPRPMAGGTGIVVSAIEYQPGTQRRLHRSPAQVHPCLMTWGLPRKGEA